MAVAQSLGDFLAKHGSDYEPVSVPHTASRHETADATHVAVNTVTEQSG